MLSTQFFDDASDLREMAWDGRGVPGIPGKIHRLVPSGCGESRCA